MNAQSLQVQIKSLETQISVLKAQLASNSNARKPASRFSDLYGILSGQSNSTEEEIRSAEYRFDWNEKAEGREELHDSCD